MLAHDKLLFLEWMSKWKSRCIIYICVREYQEIRKKQRWIQMVLSGAGLRRRKDSSSGWLIFSWWIFIVVSLFNLYSYITLHKTTKIVIKMFRKRHLISDMSVSSFQSVNLCLYWSLWQVLSLRYIYYLINLLISGYHVGGEEMFWIKLQGSNSNTCPDLIYLGNG